MYKVSLHMAEIFHTETGRRVFDVFIEGDRVLTDLDLVQDIGAAFTAKEYMFTKEVSDGVLDISFVAKVDYAKVSGIEVILDPSSKTDPIVAPTMAPALPAGGGAQNCVDSTELLENEINAATDPSNKPVIVLCDGTLTLSQAVNMTDKSFFLTSESGSSKLSGGSRTRIFIGSPLMASFSGINFSDGDASDDHGGALYVLGGEVTIKNCVFENNKALRGAAIFLDNGAAVNIVGSSFSNNFAIQVSVLNWT